MIRLEQCSVLLCWLVLASPVTAQQTSQVKCEHAAPPRGTHYVCDNPQNPCSCRVVPDDPNAPRGDYARDITPLARQVWADPHRKLYYCSEEKPKKHPKSYTRLTEEEASRRGYKPASEAACEPMEGTRK
jgi:hypothetical protein